MSENDAINEIVRVRSVRLALNELSGSDCRVVYDYWNTIRGNREAPTWPEFDLIKLPPECIRHIHVVDVHHDPFDIVFRFWGTGLTDVLRFDRTGDSVLKTTTGYLTEERRPGVVADYRYVIDNCAPSPFLWNVSPIDGRGPHLTAPGVRLPLMSDGAHVTQIVSLFDFTADRLAWKEMFEVKKRQRGSILY